MRCIMRGEKRGYLGGNGDITEALLIFQVLERGDHVSLEVVPAETELLLVIHGLFINNCSENGYNCIEIDFF